MFDTAFSFFFSLHSNMFTFFCNVHLHQGRQRLQPKEKDITVTVRGLSGFQVSAECCGLVPSADREEAHVLQSDAA